MYFLNNAKHPLNDIIIPLNYAPEMAIKNIIEGQ